MKMLDMHHLQGKPKDSQASVLRSSSTTKQGNKE